jgi:hypothetical protein
MIVASLRAMFKVMHPHLLKKKSNAPTLTEEKVGFGYIGPIAARKILTACHSSAS